MAEQKGKKTVLTADSAGNPKTVDILSKDRKEIKGVTQVGGKQHAKNVQIVEPRQ